MLCQYVWHTLPGCYSNNMILQQNEIANHMIEL